MQDDLTKLSGSHPFTHPSHLPVLSGHHDKTRSESPKTDLETTRPSATLDVKARNAAATAQTQADLVGLGIELSKLRTVVSPKVTTGEVENGDAPRAGRFTIVRPHAHGGLGAVHVAIDGELNREVALKEILPRYAGDIESRQRFTREAEVTGRLEHPGIVPVYGLGTYPDGRPYYAMRFIRGTSLKSAIEELHSKEKKDSSSTKGMDLRSLLNRFVDVCNAMAFAHSRGIIHRDIKPANIMLGDFGETLVVDWGLAKSVGATEAHSHMPGFESLELDSTVDQTRTGSAMGTPQYMSPEQAAGKVTELGPASDIYSLGATLYNLLTGKVPISGNNVLTVLAHVQAGEFPRPRQVDPKIDRALEAICLKAMAKDPANRYPTAIELAKDIERWMADEPVTAYREPWTLRLRRWSRRHRVIVATASSMLIVAVVALSISTALISREHSRTKAARADEEIARRRAESESRRARESEEQTRQLLVQSQLMDGFGEMESGDMLSGLVWFAEALRQDAGQLGRAWAHRVRIGTMLRKAPQLDFIFAPQSGARDAAFSPDSKRVIVATANGSAAIWNLQKRREERVFHHPGPINEVAFSPKGDRVVIAGEDGTACIWNVADGEKVTTSLRHKGPVLRAIFSPNGELVATAGLDRQLKVWEAQSGRPLGEPLQHQDRIDHIVFSPDGRYLVGVSGNWDEAMGAANGGDLIVWDLQTFAPAFPPLRDRKHAYTYAEFSPDGSSLVICSLDGTAQIINAKDGNRIAPPLRHHSWVDFASFSPDGKKVATASSDSTVAIWDVVSGQQLLQPLHHGGVVSAVQWNSKGTRLLTACRDGTASIWDASVGDLIGSPMRHGSSVLAATFAPDDSRVMTVGGGAQERQVRIWRPDAAVELTPAMAVLDDTSPAKISENLQRLAMVTASGEILIRDRDTQRSWTLPHDQKATEVWISPDGQYLAVLEESEKLSMLQIVEMSAVKIPIHGISNVRDLVFDHRSERFAAQLDDRTVRIWSIQSGLPATGVLKHQYSVTHMEFNKTNDVLVVATGEWTSLQEGTDGGQAHLWVVETGKPLTAPLLHDGSIRHATFSPDGKRLVTSGVHGDSGETRVWELPTGKALASIRHRGPASHACFSPDGKRIATATGILSYSGGTARIWDADTGTPLSPPIPHPGPVELVAFGEHGRLLVTGCPIHSHKHVELRVWDAHTGEAITAPVHREGRNLEVVRFEPEKLCILIGVDGNVWTLNLFPNLQPAEQVAALVRLLADQCIDETGSLGPLSREDMIEAHGKLGPFCPRITLVTED